MLSGTTLHTFAATLNGLPVGLSRATDLGRTRCRDQGALGSLEGAAAGDSEAYRVEVRYPTGSPSVLVGRLGQCGELGISNGARAGQLTENLEMLLADTVSTAQGWAQSVVPAR